jgi:hypothetical protein
MYTNYSNVSLPLAVWLATDHYQTDTRPNAISATGLMRPTKSLVLSATLTPEEQVVDVIDMVPSRLGTAFHDSVELAWQSQHYPLAMETLGIPEDVIRRVRINPSRPALPDNRYIDIWLEQRAEKKIAGWIVTGQFDLVYENGVQDYKSTKTYSWISRTNDEKYRIQGSIYRWLNQDIITKDYLVINFLFTDWSQLKAQADKAYPQLPVMTRKYPLMSIAETEAYILGRLNELTHLMGKPESELPDCTPEELWQKPSTWAYYKNPASTARATKVFDNPGEAQMRAIQDGSKGLVVHRPGEVKFCRYCPAVSICQQAEKYRSIGLLVGG